jgi:uncharacterized protein YbaA (DUF1428 family)
VNAALAHVDHVCAVCESDCDKVTALRVDVKALQHALLVMAWNLREARELRDFALSEIERRWPDDSETR